MLLASYNTCSSLTCVWSCCCSAVPGRHAAHLQHCSHLGTATRQCHAGWSRRLWQADPCTLCRLYCWREMLPDTGHKRVGSVHSSWFKWSVVSCLVKKINLVTDRQDPELALASAVLCALQQQLTYKHCQANFGLLLCLTLRCRFTCIHTTLYGWLSSVLDSQQRCVHAMEPQLVSICIDRLLSHSASCRHTYSYACGGEAAWRAQGKHCVAS